MVVRVVGLDKVRVFILLFKCKPRDDTQCVACTWILGEVLAWGGCTSKWLGVRLVSL